MAGHNFLEIDSASKSVFSVVEEPDFGDFDMDLQAPDFKSITPAPGFCVKTKTDNNEKIFINVCHSPDVPPPPATLDVHKIIAGEDKDEALFRFPLSLGDPHPEIDKSGKRCKCYDVVINSEYYQEVCKKSELRDFIMTLSCSGLERKYNISIDVGACAVLNKRYHGKMPSHYIRLKSAANCGLGLKSKITPKDEENNIVMPVKNPTRLTIAPEIVHYKLFKVPAEEYPSSLVFQGITKGVENKKSIRVFVSECSLTVRSPESTILLKIALPFDVIPEMSLSNFSKSRLIVYMNVVPSELED